MTLTLEALVVQIATSIIVLVPVLWVSARLLVGVENAKFADALWIGAVGALIGTFFGALSLSSKIAPLILFIIWVILAKHFFDSDWQRALAITIIGVLIFVAIAVLLATLGLAP
jgi:hypothetical protein